MSVPPLQRAIDLLDEVVGAIDSEMGVVDVDQTEWHELISRVEEFRQDCCEHEWVDLRNQSIDSGEMCKKCGHLRAGNDDA